MLDGGNIEAGIEKVDGIDDGNGDGIIGAANGYD